MKKKFRLEDYPGQEMRMICYNEEEAKTFCNFLKSCGKTWKSGDSYEETNWLECFGPLLKSGNFVMAYYFNQGCYHPTSRNVANESINVCPEKCLNFSDFDWEEKIMFKFEIGETAKYYINESASAIVTIEDAWEWKGSNCYDISSKDFRITGIPEYALAKVPGTDTNVGTKEELHIKDSGSRTEYSTGAVRDVKVGKGRCDLLPLDVVGNILTGHSSTILNCINDFKRGSDERLQTAILEFCAEREWSKEEMLLEVSKHFEEGAEKYGEYNWQKGIPIHSYIDSAIRHYLKYKAGWKDERHDRAFVWNILCCLWTMRHAPEMDDYTDLKELNPEGGWEDK